MPLEPMLVENFERQPWVLLDLLLCIIYKALITYYFHSMHRVTGHHPELLKLIQLNSDEHQKVEKTLLKLADYDRLRALLKIIPPTLNFMTDSMARLDVKAIKIVLEAIPNSSQVQVNIRTLITKLQEKLFEHDFSLDSPAELEKFMLSTKERWLRAKEILTMILKSLPAIQALKEEIELKKARAHFNSNVSFTTADIYLDLFAQAKVFNLLDPNLWDFVAQFFTLEELLSLVPIPAFIELLKRSKYEEFNEAALLSINAGAIYSASNIITSRTYSSTILKNDLEPTYHNLLCSDNQMIRAFMNILAVNIADGDDVKILFSAKIDSSYYDPENNVIFISMEHQNIYKYWTIPSMFIHVVGFYTIQKLYNSKGMPMPFYSIMKKYIQYINNLRAFLGPYSLDDVVSYVDFIPVLSSRIFDYEQAAKGPVVHAAKLLGMEETKFVLYNFREGFLNSFIENSPIGVFMQKYLDDYTQEETNSTWCVHISAAITRAYLNDVSSDECPIAVPLSQDFNATKKYVMERVLPKIIEQRHLTASQVFYLKRIADYTYRKECGGSSEGLSSDLLVIGAELYVGGVDASEMQPFDGLAQHWRQYIQPDVQTLLDSHIERCASLLETTTGYYHCNDTQCNGTLQGAVPLYCIGELVSPPLKDCH